ncbi:hypothetical protein C7A12_04775 [Pseudomonas fluorescens]|nr:hypothetical protein C7A12_04775 [Pseudomonas fluorescens]PRW81738.1 hypothetical protein C7A13_05900 [Pseudomonas fluorescens]
MWLPAILEVTKVYFEYRSGNPGKQSQPWGWLLRWWWTCLTSVLNDAAGRARQGNGWALGAPLIKKCAILSAGSALDQLYAGKCDECCAG